MKIELSSHLACPSCFCLLKEQGYHYQNNALIEGFLYCDDCSIAIPVIQGFPLFTEATENNLSLNQQWLTEQNQHWFGKASYASFLNLKSARQMYDSYAFFQPFNESSRALLALSATLREQLSKGDIILDTWSRTGWTGEWLAALFPEQEIISIWEGNNNVLGYKGFAHWLPESQRQQNLSILFTHADNPLPLASNSVQLTIGLDSLHRYAQDSFLAECRRVTAADGILFFPHIHLTNDEPEPFFERGCHQIHGKDWKGLLDNLYSDSSYMGFVFSEDKLFNCADYFVIEDDSDTPHYNGAVLIAPKTWNGRKVKTEHNCPIKSTDRLILNPIINIDLTQAKVSIELTPLIDDLMLRHPVYQSRIEQVLDKELSELECKIIFYADKALTVIAIAALLNLSVEQVGLAADRLYQREILFPAAVSKSMAVLQAYYGNLQAHQSAYIDFADLWQELADRYQTTAMIETEDGAEYDWESTNSLVEATINWLQASSAPTDRILICTENCPELFILIWACCLSGRVAVPIDATLPPAVIEEIIARCSAKIIFSTQPLSAPHFSFDSLTAEDSLTPLFSEQIEPYIDQALVEPIKLDPQAAAILLFTSGSTGQPKAVVLNQTGLLHSAQALVQHFAWASGDRLLSLGPAHTMSGLRNPALAALISGSTIVIPDAGIMHVGRLLQILKHQQITHVATVPALLQQLLASQQRLLDEALPEQLQQIICTGQSLPVPIREQVSDWLKTPIYSYYGLTETGGICLADSLTSKQQGSLGFPSAAIAQIVNAEHQVLARGEQGELRVYSPANMLAYWEAETVSTVKLDKGWIYTGDRVELMEDGSFNYVGRKDDQVKNHAGEVIFLQQLEQLVSQLPEVHDNCCINIQNQQTLSASLILFVVAEESEQTQLQNPIYAQIDRVLGQQKRPDEIVFIPVMQRFSNGKVDRHALEKFYMSKQTNV